MLGPLLVIFLIATIKYLTRVPQGRILFVSYFKDMFHSSEEGMAEGAGGSRRSSSLLFHLFLFSLEPHPTTEAALSAHICEHAGTHTHTYTHTQRL